MIRLKLKRWNKLNFKEKNKIETKLRLKQNKLKDIQCKRLEQFCQQ